MVKMGHLQSMTMTGVVEWKASHCSGRHFRTKLMSRYIGAGQNDWLDVRIQELVSKAKNSRGFLRKKRF